MTSTAAGEHQALREAVRDLCSRFDGAYWREGDEKRA